MSIQYTVLGFKPTTFRTCVSEIYEIELKFNQERMKYGIF